MKLLEDIKNYMPINEQERRDRALLLEMLNKNDDLFTRENRAAHFTASSWTINKTRDKALMVYHNIYNSWSWLGGHADGNEDLLSVAIQEVKEESGLKNVTPISEDIFSLEILTVDGHEKRGEYVSSHLHLNVTYLLQADDSEPLRLKPDENSGVRWFPLREAVEASSEKWFQERIYSKLNAKLEAREAFQ